MLPEEMIAKLKKSILPQWKVCFWSALVVGLFTHIYKLTNWLPNWDSLVFRYDPQNMLGLGRWFLPVACGFSSFYDLPWLNGFLAIVFHALGAVCLCRMFAVGKNITAALIGAMVISFPAVTSVMMYNYVADGYALSFLLACAAASCLTAEKPKYLSAVLMITLSVGIYQAYITVTIMLLLCWLIRQAVQNKADVKQTIAKSARLLAAGALGMALYYLVLNLLLRVTGIELLEYQSIQGALSLSELDLWASVYTMKHSLLDFFFDLSGGWRAFHLINCVVIAATVAFYLYDVYKNRLSVSKLCLLAVWVLLLPIGASVLALVNSSVDYHNLMKMGFCVFYLFFLLQYERTQWNTETLNRIKQWGILVVSVVLIFNQVIIANVSYHKLHIAYEKSYGTLIRIADRIEQTEGAADCDRILVIGSLPESQAYSANVSLDMTGTTDGFILRFDDESVGQSVLCSALNDYCGTNYRFLAGEEKNALLQQIAVENLGAWPDKRSVTVVNDVIVVKLGDEP